MTDKRFSRRRFLWGGVAAGAAGLAGCSRTGLSGGQTPSNQVFEEASISGSNLVVTLQEQHEIDEMVLISPDGDTFRAAKVENDETVTQLSLFDFFSGQHYSPGEHRLAAKRDGENIASKVLDLVPKLEIIETGQYLGGEATPENRGNVLVTVKNTGSGPTWAYYLGYDNTPRESYAPREGHPTNSPLQALKKPESENNTILGPGETQTFLGRWPPFLFSGDEHCRELEIDFTLTVYSGVGSNVRQDLRATLSGEELQVLYEVTCSTIDIETTDRGTTDG